MAFLHETYIFGFAIFFPGAAIAPPSSLLEDVVKVDGKQHRGFFCVLTIIYCKKLTIQKGVMYHTQQRNVVYSNP